MDRGKLRVFISYSREDLDFADQLSAALDFSGFECFIDRHGISGGEEWKRRLGNLISEADTVVFVLSPDSAVSKICAWEVDEATRLNKRILSVNCRPLKGASPPPRLRDLNYIYFYAEPKAPGSGFGTGLAQLVTALNTDFDWLREHTRYLQRATEWDRGGRPANRLLSGDDIAEAKAWMARRPNGAPEPTTLHLDFIRASEEEAEARLSAQRKQLEAMAAAQAERETALKKAEDAQRKRVTMARIRNIALMGVSFLVLIAGWLGLKAEQEREEAAEQRNILEAATTYMVTSQTEPNEEKKREAFSLVLVLFQRGADRGDAFYIRNLALLYQALGPAQDYTKAREWYEKAADKGDATALGNLGRLYDTGLGVTQDYTKAREWLEKAAAKGNTDAMINIGLLYANGQGVTRDYGKAREWYEKAAAKDNTTAMSNLGELYYNGQGVTRDYGKAREWYEKAAAKGDAKAKARLKELEASRSGKAGKVR
jgi:TPR repeat protein